jgi:periplasmic divalent cation tolerance protein
VSDAGVLVVLVTTPDSDSGHALARALVEERLAACVNVLPGLRSIYRWEGAVEEADECLLLIKVRTAGVARLAERVVELHPYEVPEVVALPVVAGLEGYLEWVERESRGEMG